MRFLAIYSQLFSVVDDLRPIFQVNISSLLEPQTVLHVLAQLGMSHALYILRDGDKCAAVLIFFSFQHSLTKCLII